MALLLSLKTYVLFLSCFLRVFIVSSKLLESVSIPALYVFGDSLVDSGNNNHLNTLAKANYPPYGVDFEGGKPTGRFSNGKTIADYIAINYGLPLVPPYLGLSDSQREHTSTGINYASAVCGIYPQTGNRIQGVTCLSLSNQTELFERTVKIDLPKIFKTEKEVRSHLAQSVFMTAIGVNDYNQLYNATETDPNTFANKLLYAFSKQLMKLHKLGARRFFINNVKPSGCYPDSVAKTVPRGSCDEQLNRAISLYNTKLKRWLNVLRRKLHGTSFVYSDYFNFVLSLRGTLKNPVNSRLLNAIKPCCPRDNVTGFCAHHDTSCASRDMHMFFDSFHPTQTTNFMYAVQCFRERDICQDLKD